MGQSPESALPTWRNQSAHAPEAGVPRACKPGGPIAPFGRSSSLRPSTGAKRSRARIAAFLEGSDQSSPRADERRTGKLPRRAEHGAGAACPLTDWSLHSLKSVKTPLAKRALTALVLIPLSIAVVLLAPTPYFALTCAIMIMLGAWEWGALAGLGRAARWLYAVLSGAIMYGLYQHGIGTDLGTGVLVAAVLWWIIALLWVIRYQLGRGGARLRTSVSKVMVGWFILIPAWVALVAIHADATPGPPLVIILLCLVWAADTGAYFAGRQWGSLKLASRVSPGKSWEGVGGAALAAGLVGWGSGAWLGYHDGALVRFVLLCLATMGVSVLGDLTESLFKRGAGVKDSGAMLPGHGGLLDRVDSLTAAAPLFALGWMTLEGVR